MIISFSVSNFRSFSSEETLSLVSSKRLAGRHENHTVPIPDSKEEVLKTSVLYGANGAGKSNLFRALGHMKSAILKPRKKNRGTGRDVFRFNGEANTPSSFDLQFIVSDRVYRYGFKVNDNQILEEWLIQVVGCREKVIYERIADDKGNVIIEAPGFKPEYTKLNALVTVGGLQNQLFLATILATLDTEDISDELKGVATWFSDDLTLISPSSSYSSLGHLLANDDKFREFAGEFLKATSTGIDHLGVTKKEISEDELHSLLPERVISELLEEINEDEDQAALVKMGEGKELLIEKSNENHYYSITIQAAHSGHTGESIPLDLSEESDGTRRLLNLIPALHHLRKEGAVYFIDEIDRSMHPILAWKFLEFFLKSCEGDKQQVIVTTHESNLLDLSLLRRDEIWFVEKDANSCSRLYSMSDFKVRNDLEIRKHYLQGRFGAIPFLGNLDNLLATDQEI